MAVVYLKETPLTAAKKLVLWGQGESLGQNIHL